MTVCDCGNTNTVRESVLTAGDSLSCGCLRTEMQARKFKPKAPTFTCAECKHEREAKTRVGDVCARCWEASMPSSGVQVGMRFGRLLVTKMRPMIALCDCGNIVTNRQPYHLAHGRLRSCGCLRKDKRKETNARWASIELLNPEDKVEFRTYRVICTRCGTQHERGTESVLRPTQTGGCSACYRRDKSEAHAKIAATKLAKAQRKAAADAV